MDRISKQKLLDSVSSYKGKALLTPLLESCYDNSKSNEELIDNLSAYIYALVDARNAVLGKNVVVDKRKAK